MTQVTVKLTTKDLQLLTALASDQLFRREFIDPRMPGQRPNTEEIRRGKLLVTRLRSTLDAALAKGRRTRAA